MRRRVSVAAWRVFDLDSSRLLTRDAAALGAEHELHHPPVQVDDQPHRPWGDEEQHEAGHEHSDVGTEPGGSPPL